MGVGLTSAESAIRSEERGMRAGVTKLKAEEGKSGQAN